MSTYLFVGGNMYFSALYNISLNILTLLLEFTLEKKKENAKYYSIIRIYLILPGRYARVPWYTPAFQ